jgi:hypothetical protein
MGLFDSIFGAPHYSVPYLPPPPLENPNNGVDSSRINQEFQSALGRPATQDEIDHFSKYVKSGDISYDEIGQVVQGLPEAQSARLNQYGQQYADKLGASDNQILGRAADVANSQFVRLGRGNSSALGSQIASAGQQLALGRQSALAQFYGQGYGSLMDQYGNQGQGAMQRAYGLTDSRTAYNRQLQGARYGYQADQNNSVQLMNQQQDINRRQAFGSLVGAGLGAAIGASNGGGMAGARLGAGIGSNAGGLF